MSVSELVASGQAIAHFSEPVLDALLSRLSSEVRLFRGMLIYMHVYQISSLFHRLQSHLYKAMFV